MVTLVPINIIRCISLFSLVFFINNPQLFAIVFLSCSALYSLGTTTIMPTKYTKIVDLAIGRIPTCILIIITSLYKEEWRFYLLCAAGLQYLANWIQMYADIYTKVSKKSIKNLKLSPLIVEIPWILSDVFLMMLFLTQTKAFEIEGSWVQVYQISMGFFIIRKVIDAIGLANNLLKIISI
ncbi:unnamed protein product [Blepharisma stoltei]|uniref:Uncharacterized protein n=1 Tax=Blepharisma stoltei TaxID=1481888 RepID=A0AAU9JRS9_9CILI|nr:unnamed protein product [Blepharisma stoltei]